MLPFFVWITLGVGSSIAQDLIVFGPGIDAADVIFPSRYVFILHRIQFDRVVFETNEEARRNTKTCQPWSKLYKESQFCLRSKANIESGISLDNLELHFEYCNLDDHNPLDYRLAIVRYRLYGQHECNLSGLQLVVFDDHNNVLHRHTVKTSDGRLTIRAEPCPYDVSNVTQLQWSQLMQCDSRVNRRLSQRIHEDLKIFRQDFSFSNYTRFAMQTFASHPLSYAYCHYQIISNQLYKKCYGQYDGFSKFYDEILLSLLRKVHLLDTELLVNLGDYPLSEQRYQPMPMFSWCGSRDTFDIVLPTYDLSESILHTQARIANDVFSIFGDQTRPFSRKQNGLFWRGRDSNRQRLTLARLARRRPELLNASITNFFFFKDDAEELGNNRTKSYIPLTAFFDYRYQVNIDGTVAAYRLPFLLAGDSLVLKQASKYYEFFYHLLKHGEHYLELDENLENLEHLAECLVRLEDNRSSACVIGEGKQVENMEQVKKMIWRGRLLVLTHLAPSNIYCYYHNALQAYTDLLKNAGHVVKLDKNLEKICETSDNTGGYVAGSQLGCGDSQSTSDSRDEL